MCLAIPGQIAEIVDEANRLAQVEVAGVRRTINVALIESDEARATRLLLEQMGAEYEQELEELKASVIE
jgi:hydrogenase expression/formation protein HypC